MNYPILSTSISYSIQNLSTNSGPKYKPITLQPFLGQFGYNLNNIYNNNLTSLYFAGWLLSKNIPRIALLIPTCINMYVTTKVHNISIETCRKYYKSKYIHSLRVYIGIFIYDTCGLVNMTYAYNFT